MGGSQPPGLGRFRKGEFQLRAGGQGDRRERWV